MRPLHFLPLLALFACGIADEVRLEGDRSAIREAEGAATGALDSAPVLNFAAAATNADWTHENGGPSHDPGHVALSYPLQEMWRVGIGRGSSREGRLTSAPVVSDGRIFTLDAAAVITATDTNGQMIWRRDLTPEGERPLDGFGGGVAVKDDTVLVGTGFAELIALDAATGELRWTQELDAPVRAAPTVLGKRVFVVARDDQGYSIDLENGRIRWRTQGLEPGAGIIGGASPAAAGSLVILPFASGEVAAALTRNGRRVWTALISGGRRGSVRARINDITSDPVIAGNTVYVANQSGRLVAINRTNGSRRWQATEGALGPVLATAGSVFVVTDKAMLQRRSAQDGDLIWSVAMPEFADPEDREDAILHSGPVLAGGRLLVVSSDDRLRSFDPATGASLGETVMNGGASTQPAVANGVLYVVTTEGELVALN